MLLGKSACRIYGIWINSRIKNMHFCCRSPRGERGLKFFFGDVDITTNVGRSPRGERGLKSADGQEPARPRNVAPPAGSVD